MDIGHYVYILECRDKTFYIGYARNISKRIKEHNESPRGAKYTRGRRPVKIVYYEFFESRSEALKYENYLKKKSRLEKLGIVQAFQGNLDL